MVCYITVPNYGREDVKWSWRGRQRGDQGYIKDFGLLEGHSRSQEGLGRKKIAFHKKSKLEFSEDG